MKANTTGKSANVPEDKIIDIHIAGVKKQKFRIDGDDSKIIELNTSDIGIADRLADVYPKLDDYNKQAQELQFEVDEDNFDPVKLKESTSKLAEIDVEMRTLVDFLFDSAVSSVCAPSGTMYDPVEGTFRYEIIIEALTNLYSDNFSKQMKLARAKVKANTKNFTKKK